MAATLPEVGAPAARGRRYLWPWALVAAMAAVKLWLVADLPFVALNAPHDDLLFLDLGHHLQRGRWLGPYSHLTLIKGPGYPFFLALTEHLGLPLRFAQELLYALACVLAMVAVRPLRPAPAALAGLGAMLLFNPITCSTIVAARILREGIYPALALATLSGGPSRR